MRSLKIALMACLLTASASAGIAAEPLVLATGEWPPYTSKHLEGYGIISRIVSAVVREMGMTAEFRFYPWKRAELLTRAGAVFGAFPYAITEERKEAFDFSHMILESRTVFIYNKRLMAAPPTWEGLLDLGVYRIGGVIGYSYVPLFEKAGLPVEYVTLDEQNIKKLFTGRLDLVIANEAVGRTLIRRLYPDKQDTFGITGQSIIVGHSHLMISRSYPGHARLKERFNRALERIRENGTYRALLAESGL